MGNSTLKVVHATHRRDVKRMGKKYNIFNRKDIGSIGIGAMIIFIAMVLVAGIAASVLIQTSTSLEMQALRTGAATTSEVASGMTVESVEGSNTSGEITKLAIEISSRAGSPDVDLKETIIEISDSSNKYVLRYGDTLTNVSSVDGDVFAAAAWPASSTVFYIIVLQDADDSVNETTPIINYGDHVILAVDSDSVFGGIVPRTDVFGLVIPEEGAPGIVGFTTPAAYSEPVLELQ